MVDFIRESSAEISVKYGLYKHVIQFTVHGAIRNEDGDSRSECACSLVG